MIGAKRPLRKAAVTLVAVGAVTLPLTTPAVAADTPSPREGLVSALAGRQTAHEDGKVFARDALADERMRRQQPLLDLKDSIIRHATDNKIPGYVSARVDIDAGSVLIFWHGAVPEAVLAHAGKARGSIDLRFAQVPYSLQQILDEAARILDTSPSHVVSAGPNHDYTGLTVGIDTRKKALRSTRIDSTMPVQLEPKAPASAARYADTVPYWGGAMLINQEDTWACSAGWSVDLGDGGPYGMITAGHCPSPSGTWLAGISDRVVGQSISRSNPTDAQLLVGQSYAGGVYTGPWDSTTGRAVHAWSQAVEGEMVCEDGAFSGEWCDTLVFLANTFWEYEDLGRVGPGYETIRQAISGGSAGEGDSGGPSYSRRTVNGQGKVVLHGMIQGIDMAYQTDCQGIGAGTNDRDCSLKVFNVDVNAINRALGVTPITS